MLEDTSIEQLEILAQEAAMRANTTIDGETVTFTQLLKKLRVAYGVADDVSARKASLCDNLATMLDVFSVQTFKSDEKRAQIKEAEALQKAHAAEEELKQTLYDEEMARRASKTTATKKTTTKK